MAASLRFGPSPPDLVLARKIPKVGYGMYAKHSFVVVRARLSGEWALGVLREWSFGGAEGWCVRIETSDPGTAGSARSAWYVFQPGSIDPLHVNAETGEVRLVPPGLRTARSDGASVR